MREEKYNTCNKNIEESPYFHPEEYQSTADRKALLELPSFWCYARGHYIGVRSWWRGCVKLSNYDNQTKEAW